MCESVVTVLVLLVVMAIVSVQGAGHTHAHPSPALTKGKLRTGSTLATIIFNSTADVAAEDGQCTLCEAMIATNMDMASGNALASALPTLATIRSI